MPAGTKTGLEPQTRIVRLHTSTAQRLATLLFVTTCALAFNARAQDVPVTPAAPAPGPEAPTVTGSTEQAPQLVEPTPPPPPSEPLIDIPPAPPAEEPAPATAPPAIKIGIGFRTGLAMVLDDPIVLTLDDGLADQVNIRPYFTGQLNDNVGVFTQLELGTARGLGGFAILDAIAQVKIVDELQIWLGHHIPANDRNNMNGPFFNNGFNFPLQVPTYPMDSGARDRGVTFWGLIANGVLKYHASMVDLQKGRDIGTARFAGRVTLHLLEPENFYYNSGTYFGSQDVLAIGAVATYQKASEVGLDTDGDGMPDAISDDTEYAAFSFDVMFEKNFGKGGTLTLDGAYWNTKRVGADYVVNQGSVDAGIGVEFGSPGQSFMIGASWLTPDKIGLGQIQPNVRFQYSDYEGGLKTNVVDIGVGYIIDGYNDRWYLNYRHIGVEDAEDTSVLQVGVQLMI